MSVIAQGRSEYPVIVTSTAAREVDGKRCERGRKPASKVPRRNGEPVEVRLAIRAGH